MAADAALQVYDDRTNPPLGISLRALRYKLRKFRLLTAAGREEQTAARSPRAHRPLTASRRKRH